jgi:hypothetical protein
MTLIRSAKVLFMTGVLVCSPTALTSRRETGFRVPVTKLGKRPTLRVRAPNLPSLACTRATAFVTAPLLSLPQPNAIAFLRKGRIVEDIGLNHDRGAARNDVRQGEVILSG